LFKCPIHSNHINKHTWYKKYVKSALCKKITYAMVLLLCLHLSSNQLHANNTSTTSNYVSKQQITQLTKKYNSRAGKRLSLWNKMMIKASKLDELQQLKAVNNYFNRIKYLRDKKHWGKNDYWSTIFEFIGSGAGDCEDFATAKYFSLKLLGIADEKLELSYVKLTTRQKKYDANHMVLSYFTSPDAVPILLDNVNLRLKLATERPDITPVFSFNASGLLKSKHKGNPSKTMQYNLAAWQKLMQRN